MARQNIYDDEAFFDRFKALRGNAINFNDCIEHPIITSMLPDVRGKDILDIGCGMGQHAKQYADMGARSVLGIDISEKMLDFARKHHAAQNITYQRLAMEDIAELDGRFDLITSSLAFDYAEDLGELMAGIGNRMREDGKLVFSMSHPMATAWDGTYDRYTRSESGERLYANIGNYFAEGRRVVKWVVVEAYEFYHRTLASIIHAITEAGLVIEACQESRVSEELRNQYPDLFGGTIHRPDFIFFRCRKGL